MWYISYSFLDIQKNGMNFSVVGVIFSRTNPIKIIFQSIQLTLSKIYSNINPFS